MFFCNGSQAAVRCDLLVAACQHSGGKQFPRRLHWVGKPSCCCRRVPVLLVHCIDVCNGFLRQLLLKCTQILLQLLHAGGANDAGGDKPPGGAGAGGWEIGGHREQRKTLRHQMITMAGCSCLLCKCTLLCHRQTQGKGEHAGSTQSSNGRAYPGAASFIAIGTWLVDPPCPATPWCPLLHLPLPPPTVICTRPAPARWVSCHTSWQCPCTPAWRCAPSSPCSAPCTPGTG